MTLAVSSPQGDNVSKDGAHPTGGSRDGHGVATVTQETRAPGHVHTSLGGSTRAVRQGGGVQSLAITPETLKRAGVLLPRAGAPGALATIEAVRAELQAMDEGDLSKRQQARRIKDLIKALEALRAKEQGSLLDGGNSTPAPGQGVSTPTPQPQKAMASAAAPPATTPAGNPSAAAVRAPQQQQQRAMAKPKATGGKQQQQPVGAKQQAKAATPPEQATRKTLERLAMGQFPEHVREDLANSGLSLEAMGLLASEKGQPIGGLAMQRHCPGWHMDGMGKWEGLAIPYLDQWGHQVTYADPDGNPAPFTRKKMLDPQRDGAKYLSPRGSGVHYFHSHILMAQLGSEKYNSMLQNPSYPIIITEGEKKCESLAWHRQASVGKGKEFIPIGLSGVGCIKPGGEFTLPDIATLRGRQVVIGFDSDMWFNENHRSRGNIRGAACTLALYLTRAGAIVDVLLMPPALGGGKLGADDLISRYGVQAMAWIWRGEGETLLPAGQVFQTWLPGAAKPVDGIKLFDPQNREPLQFIGDNPEAPSIDQGTPDPVDNWRPDGATPHSSPPDAMANIQDPEDPRYARITIKTDPAGRVRLTAQQKASLMAAVLGLDYAWRESTGTLYKWDAKKGHWQEQENGRTAVHQLLQDYLNEGLNRRCPSVSEAATIASFLKHRLAVPEDKWQRQLLTFQNGVLDPATGKLTPPRRLDYQTAAFPCQWDTTAECPTWRRFLASAGNGNSQFATLLQAVTRYLMEPLKPGAAPLERIFWCHGPGGGGKGTFLEAIRHAVGEGHCRGWNTDTFKDRHGLAGLAGGRYAIAMDLGGAIKADGLNELISNEAVTVRAMYQQAVSMRLNVRMLAASNQLPTFTGGSAEGMQRRLIVLPFLHPPTEPDTGLKDRLRGEAAGIWQWAMAMPLADALGILKDTRRHCSTMAGAMGDATEESLVLAPFLRSEYPTGAGLPMSSIELLEALNNRYQPIGARMPCDSPAAVGRHMAAVARAFPDWVSKSKQRTRQGFLWTINAPPGAGAAAEAEDATWSPPDPGHGPADAAPTATPAQTLHTAKPSEGAGSKPCAVDVAEFQSSRKAEKKERETDSLDGGQAIGKGPNKEIRENSYTVYTQGQTPGQASGLEGVDGCAGVAGASTHTDPAGPALEPDPWAPTANPGPGNHPGSPDGSLAMAAATTAPIAPPATAGDHTDWFEAMDDKGRQAAAAIMNGPINAFLEAVTAAANGCWGNHRTCGLTRKEALAIPGLTRPMIQQCLDSGLVEECDDPGAPVGEGTYWLTCHLSPAT